MNNARTNLGEETKTEDPGHYENQGYIWTARKHGFTVCNRLQIASPLFHAGMLFLRQENGSGFRQGAQTPRQMAP